MHELIAAREFLQAKLAYEIDVFDVAKGLVESFFIRAPLSRVGVASGSYRTIREPDPLSCASTSARVV